jgi:hypothetical protein
MLNIYRKYRIHRQNNNVYFNKTYISSKLPFSFVPSALSRIIFFKALFAANIILFFIGIPRGYSQEKSWVLQKYEEGIGVYLRKADNSNFKELKSVVHIKTSLSSIVAVLSDWESYPEWVYRCGSSSTVKILSDSVLIHYQTVLAPWPVDSRDFVVMVKLVQEAETKRIVQSSVALPDYIPRKDGFVRIKSFRASWTLTPLEDGFIKVEYQLLVDPGGNVPAWLVNLAVVEGPLETTRHLKTRVFQKKYKEAKIPWVIEP